MRACERKASVSVVAQDGEGDVLVSRHAMRGDVCAERPVESSHAFPGVAPGSLRAAQASAL